MFNWLGKLFVSGSHGAAGRRDAGFDAAVQEAARIYQELPDKEVLDSAARGRVARQLYLDLHEIYIAASPRDAVRQKIAEAMLRFSRFQVLVIPPPPAPDASGLRGLPGISGELHAQLDKIVRNNSDLHETLYENTEPLSISPIGLLLRRAFVECNWNLQTFNALREELATDDQAMDWYRPFLFAACSNQENSYRREIGLPSAYDPQIAAAAPMAYSLFTDIVMSGASDPLQEWLDYHLDSGIPMPRFTDQA
jgi:hypothetical protein